MEWRFCLVPINEITQEMAELGHYTSPKYMRRSKTGLVLVKWQGERPEYLRNYDEIDIETELQKEEWQTDEVI